MVTELDLGGARLHPPEAFCIRPWQPGDETAILAAFNRCFPSRRTVEEWRRIYLDAPDGAEIMLCLAPTGELAAHYAATVHRALCDGSEVRVMMMRDAFTLPAYRGVRQGRRALLSMVYGQILSSLTGPGRIVLGYGFPNQRHYRIGQLLMQYRPFANWWRGQCLLAHDERTVRRRTLTSPLTVREVAGFDDAFDRLWRRAAGRYRFALIREARFLNWRFADTPKRSYWRFACAPFMSPELSGYLVFAAHNELAWLVDWHLPGSPAACLAFWQEVAARLWSRGVRRVETWCAGAAPDLSSLTQLGFTAVPRHEHFPSYSSYDPQLDPAWVEDHFHYNMADSDLV